MNKKTTVTVLAGLSLCILSTCLAFTACGGGKEHNIKEIQAKTATCTEAGNEHYYMCTDEGCGKIFSDAECKNEIKLEDVVKPALGHDPQKVEAESATCTTDGHETYYDCSRCDLNFADAAGMQDIAGTTDPARLKQLCVSADISLTREEWYSLYLSTGKTLP